MATVRKRGNAYQIRVSTGYDSTGKQLEKSMTWKPPRGMTEKQIAKELERQKVLFEEQVQNGLYLDSTITLAEFADKWFKDYAEKQLREKSLEGYRCIMPRILQALGHIKLCRLQPHHLMEFYNNLEESGVRLDTKYKACKDFKKIYEAAGYTQKSLSEAAEVSASTIRLCSAGHNIAKKTADKISKVLKNKRIFIPQNTKDKLADTTIIKYHRLLSSMLTTAVQWQIIPSNPCGRVKPPHVDYKEAAVLDEKEVEQLISCLDDEPLKYKTAVMLILYTGLRRGELCGLNCEDVDLDNGIIQVKRSLLYTTNKGIYEDTTKNKHSQRFIQIPPDMVKLLKEYKAEQARQRLLIGDQWQNSGKLITSDNGSALYPDTLSAWFRKFIKKNNLPDAHIHTLRHVSATLLIAGGVDVATVSNRLGHANKTTTLNIYTHAIKSADAMAAERLQNILNPMKHYAEN